MATQNTMQMESQATDSNSAAGGGMAEKVAGALGWFSIGLGITEIVAPRALSSFIGIRQRPNTMRLMGVREVIAGIGILATRRPAGWLLARVGGDVVDLAALARSDSPRGTRNKRIAAIGAVAGVGVLDALCARQLSSKNNGTHFTAAAVINRSPEECYRAWRDIERLPGFIDHLRSVRVTGEGRSHWIAKGPMGRDIEWDAEITEDVPNEILAWRSVGRADLPNSGRVRFEPARGNRGTVVRVLMNYSLPTRAGGNMAARLLGSDPGYRVRKDLLRFKQIMETGEIATTEGQPAGRREGATKMDRMARI